MRQRPCAIVVDIADEAEFACRLQHACHRGDGLRPARNAASSAAASATDRDGSGRSGSVSAAAATPAARRHRRRAVGCCRCPAGLDLGQDLRHAVDVRLAADEARSGKSARLRDQMFAAAEADLEPRSLAGRIEKRRRDERCRAGDIQGKPRQQVLDQVGLMRAELVALAAAEERAMRAQQLIGERRVAIIGRRVVLIATGRSHRSVWYSRCSSRARGSIDEI